jgi:hypothetical protein
MPGWVAHCLPWARTPMAQQFVLGVLACIVLMARPRTHLSELARGADTVSLSDRHTRNVLKTAGSKPLPMCLFGMRPARVEAIECEQAAPIFRSAWSASAGDSTWRKARMTATSYSPGSDSCTTSAARTWTRSAAPASVMNHCVMGVTAGKSTTVARSCG